MLQNHPFTAYRLRRLPYLLVVAALLAAACRPPHTPPPAPELDPFAEIAMLPPGLLAGRLFILDPGHGGTYTGAVTPDGLRESDVNLWVARFLQGMLRDAGAGVVMTRYADADFLPPDAPRRLGTDLHERMRIANRHRADLFISLHHNASALKDKSYNATETFVKMTDNRQSLDAAGPIHQRLAALMQTGNDMLIPGNFHVLRNSENPAVLGEAAYMTGRRMERLLRDPVFLKREAAAYFLGICDYISAGVPEIDSLAPHDTVITALRPALSAAFSSAVGIDPSSVELRINGRTVAHTLRPDGTGITWLPRRMVPNGTYDVTLDARNLNGNAARTARARYTVSRPPAHLLLRLAPETGAGVGEPLRLEAHLFDAEWTPVIDGTPVTFSAPGAHLRYRRVRIRDGRAATYCRAAAPGTVAVTAACGTLSVVQNVVLSRPAAPHIAGFVCDASGGYPLGRASLRSGTAAAVSAPDGFVSVPADTAVRDLRITRTGYIPAVFSVAWSDTVFRTFPLERSYGGALHGKRIVIDPEFGGSESGAVGRGGTRAADVNLHTARYLARYLRDAGADAVLTRDGNRNVSLQDRVLTEAETPTNLYIIIRHAGRKRAGTAMYTAHHYQSRNGRRAAADIARELHLQTGAPDEGMRADYGYPVMQTGCPAVVVNPAYITDPETEKRLARPAASRRSAYGIFCGILRYYGVQKQYPAELSGTARTGGGGTADGALVVIDGHTAVQTGPRGGYRFRMLKKGHHTVTVTHGGEVVEELTVRAE